MSVDLCIKFAYVFNVFGLMDEFKKRCLDDYDDLMKDTRSADIVIFCAENQSVRAHSLIMEVRSMNNKNKKLKTISATRFSCEAVQQYVKFLYCGYCDDMNTKIEVECLEISDCFDEEHFKKYISRFLVSKISPQNVSTILQASDDFTALELRQQCMHFIDSNALDVFQSNNFTSCLNISILQEILLRDSLRIEEETLFDSIKTQLHPKDFEKLLPYVRYCQMDPSFFSRHVAVTLPRPLLNESSNFFRSRTIPTFLRDEVATSRFRRRKFSTSARSLSPTVSADVEFPFKFSGTASSSALDVSSDGLQVHRSAVHPHHYRSAISGTFFTKSSFEPYYWEIAVEDGSDRMGVLVGVSLKGVDVDNAEIPTNGTSWLINCRNLDTCNTTWTAHPRPRMRSNAGRQDVVGVQLDVRNGLLKFFLNQQSTGIEMDIPRFAQFVPTVALACSGDAIRLQFPRRRS